MPGSNNTINRFSRLQMWAALYQLILLITFSIVEAFRGSEVARVFFNSLPLMIFWFFFTILFVLAIVNFKRLHREPGLFLLHAGCVLVLFGAMWGSETGHLLRNRFFETNKISKGYMLIYRGHGENRIISENFEQQLGQIPFDIHLDDFRIDYYWNEGTLVLQTPAGRRLTMPARPGEYIMPGDGLNGIKILRCFKNFKIRRVNGTTTISDDPLTGQNPAVEVEYAWANNKKEIKYLFEQFPEFGVLPGGWKLTYILAVRTYVGSLGVLQAGKVLRQKMIMVNDPLHYGGYYFYLTSYDRRNGEYIVLTVASDSGRGAVFSGFVLVCAGAFWTFWLRFVPGRFLRRRGHGT